MEREREAKEGCAFRAADPCCPGTITMQSMSPVRLAEAVCGSGIGQSSALALSLRKIRCTMSARIGLITLRQHGARIRKGFCLIHPRLGGGRPPPSAWR
jgi:hypothetical protein